MKNLQIITIAYLFLLPVNGMDARSQSLDSDKNLLLMVADNIVKNTNYTIVDITSGISYYTSDSIKPGSGAKIGCPYVEWKYWNGVLNVAMLELNKITGNNIYKQYAIKNYSFIFKNLFFFENLYKAGIKDNGMDQFFRFDMLDDCGAMGAGLIEVYQMDQKEEYLKYIDKVADYIINKEHRLKDGTLARLGPYNKTVWLDDLYMSVPFLARYGKLKNDDTYFKFAAKQIKQFTRYMFDRKLGLYYHCYFDTLHENGVAHWGRANGWSLMAQANLLDKLPETSNERDSLIKIFRQEVIGLARYQSEKGLWHQILDKPDSYLETSCSAMFTYAIAKGVNEGWLDENFRSIATAGWEGLKSKIRPDGQVMDICVGTGIQNDLVFYYKRPTTLNDIHGLGAVILAGTEILKLKAKK